MSPRQLDQRCSALEPRLLRVGFAAASAARCNAVALCCRDREAHISFVVSVFCTLTFMALTKLAFPKKQNKLEKNLDRQMASAVQHQQRFR